MSRRQGMFGNAKFSDKVFKNLPSNVARGVKRDIQYVVKKDKLQDVKKWNRALPSQDDFNLNSPSLDHNSLLPKTNNKPVNEFMQVIVFFKCFI